jgi:hypothetical protein
MSQFPPPAGLPYATPEMPAPSRRPTSVTVVAILAIILGSIGVLAMLCSLPQYMGLQLAPNPVMDGIRKDPLLLGYNIGSLVLGMIIAAALLAGGIASLALKPIGRKLLRGYAVAYLVITIPSLLFNLLVITPRMLSQVPNLNSNPQLKTIITYSAYGGTAFGLVFLVWPVLILYFMTRPHVKIAFEQGM